MAKKPTFTPLEAAREAWGAQMPDWVETLAIQCGRSSQAAVARDLSISGAAVSQILRSIYPAKTDTIEDRVRGVFLNGSVDCPTLGIIPSNQCSDWRHAARSFRLGSLQRAQMYRACNACPRFKPETTDEGDAP